MDFFGKKFQSDGMHLSTPFRNPVFKRLVLLSIITAMQATLLSAQTSNSVPTLQIKAGQTIGKVSPTLYGLMTEEINFTYEGGLYGELIRNRSFKARTNEVKVLDRDQVAEIFRWIRARLLNDALNVSFDELDAAKATKDFPVGIANGGYWGIPVKPKTTYQVSFYAKAATGFNGAVDRGHCRAADGKTNFASAKVSGVTGDWKTVQNHVKNEIRKPSIAKSIHHQH